MKKNSSNCSRYFNKTHGKVRLVSQIIFISLGRCHQGQQVLQILLSSLLHCLRIAVQIPLWGKIAKKNRSELLFDFAIYLLVCTYVLIAVQEKIAKASKSEPLWYVTVLWTKLFIFFIWVSVTDNMKLLVTTAKFRICWRTSQRGHIW